MINVSQKIPRLRFPEFEGEWEEKKLGEIGNIIGGGTPSTKNESYWKGEIPWISSSDLIDDNIRFVKISRHVDESAIKNSATKIIPPKSILIVSRVGVGKVAVNNESVCTSQDFQNLVLNNDNYIFIAYLVQKKAKELLEFNQGTSIKGFVKNDLLELKILIPDIIEQQKIAEFLTAIDNKIDKLSQKKELMEKYKKGLMQRIFSQKLRFRDQSGNDFPEWGEKKLNDIFNSLSSKKFQIQNSEILPTGRFRVVDQSPELISGYSNDLNKVFKNLPIIIFGDHTTILKYIDFNFIVGADGTKILKLASNNHLKYLFYNLNFNNVSQQGYKRHFTMLKETKLQIPNINEQHKIADFLTCVDENIMQVTNQLEKMREFKKGLLQGLLV